MVLISANPALESAHLVNVAIVFTVGTIFCVLISYILFVRHLLGFDFLDTLNTLFVSVILETRAF